MKKKPKTIKHGTVKKIIKLNRTIRACRKKQRSKFTRLTNSRKKFA